MRNLFAFMLLAAAMLPALGQAQTATSTPLAVVNICDRTPRVRDEILGVLSASDCATVTPAQLASVTGLCFGMGSSSPCYLNYFSDNDKIRMLKSGDFDGLTGLQELFLHGNDLTALPEDVFDGLTGLQNLYLNGNDLTALPEDVFDGLTSSSTKA